MTEPTKTVCPYCGVGCGLEVLPASGKATPSEGGEAPVWQVRGDRDHPSSQGMICVKGATVAESIDQNRLLYPMLRESLDQPFQRVSWDQALDRIVQQIQTVQPDDRGGRDLYVRLRAVPH